MRVLMVLLMLVLIGCTTEKACDEEIREWFPSGKVVADTKHNYRFYYVQELDQHFMCPLGDPLWQLSMELLAMRPVDAARAEKEKGVGQ